jgi:hypothetical protein
MGGVRIPGKKLLNSGCLSNLTRADQHLNKWLTSRKALLQLRHK